jgi:hypothetical protein
VRSQTEPVQSDAHAASDVGKLNKMGIETDLNFRHPTRGRTVVDRRKVCCAQLWDRSLGNERILTVPKGIYPDVPLNGTPSIFRVDDHI